MSRRPAGSLTLKQKLSSLSLSPSSPSQDSPVTGPEWNKAPSSPLSSFGRMSRRPGGIFGFIKNEEQTEPVHNQIPLIVTDDERRRVDAVLERLICQAGVDYETRPMVVITAAALPDPREVNYDFLLQRLMSCLDLYVENDYSVVFLTAGGKHTPGWNWVWKAYRSLSRKYRKNLKRLYIVHSTWFSKMLFSLAGAIISPKFFRKIQYVATLSELAENVPLTQIDIAPLVYQENLKYERQITLPAKEHTAVFGVPLEDLMGEFGENGGIPRVVKDCVEYLRERGMEVEGLFRRSPNSVLLRQAKEAYDRGHPVSLSSFSDPHMAAVLLKKFFRDLPEPIFPSDMYTTIRQCPISSKGSADLATITYIREKILPALRTEAAEILLSYVFHLLHDVSLRSSLNRMDAHNLALCIGPNLVGSNPMTDAQMCAIPGGPSLFTGHKTDVASHPEGQTTLGMVLKVCVERYFDIFEEAIDRSEAVSSTLVGSMTNPSDSSSIPSSSSNTEEEDDDDEELDDAMLVMPLGPTPPSSNHSSPFTNTPRSPPSAWKLKHRRNKSSQSGKSSNGSTVAGASQGDDGTASARSKHRKRAHGASRSILSIEKSIGGSGPGSKGSITLKKASNAGATISRRAGGAGVEAVGVTALGFFTPPQDAASNDPGPDDGARWGERPVVQVGRPN